MRPIQIDWETTYIHIKEQWGFDCKPIRTKQSQDLIFIHKSRILIQFPDTCGFKEVDLGSIWVTTKLLYHYPISFVDMTTMNQLFSAINHLSVLRNRCLLYYICSLYNPKPIPTLENLIFLMKITLHSQPSKLNANRQSWTWYKTWSVKKPHLRLRPHTDKTKINTNSLFKN